MKRHDGFIPYATDGKRIMVAAGAAAYIVGCLMTETTAVGRSTADEKSNHADESR